MTFKVEEHTAATTIGGKASGQPPDIAELSRAAGSLELGTNVWRTLDFAISLVSHLDQNGLGCRLFQRRLRF